MVTFAGWLAEQESRDDWTGVIACWWRDEAAVRPRVFSPSGVQRYLDNEILHGKLGEKIPDQDRRGEWRAAFAAAVKEYHNRQDAHTTQGDDLRLCRIEEKLDKLLELLGLLGDETVQEKLAEVTGYVAQDVAQHDGQPDEVPAPPARDQVVTQDSILAGMIEIGDKAAWEHLYGLADHAGAETAEATDEDAA